MSGASYPLGAFYFNVTVLGSATPLAALTAIDASFQEVSGIEGQFDTEEVAEGGENRFVYRLPRPARYPNLVLKRGVVAESSFLAEWAGQTIGSNLSLPIVPQNLLVTLLDASGMPAVAWGFVNAWPVRWQVGPLDSMQNTYLTESLEFAYNYFARVNFTGLGMAAAMAQLAARMAP